MQRTKQALADALMQLLSKKTLDKITISDIVQASGYNRQTFYYHFHDIYDLLEWIFVTETENAMQTPMTADNWQTPLLALTNRMLENKRLILNVYSSISRDQLDRYMYSAVYRLMLNVIEYTAKAAHLNVPQTDMQFIAHAYKYVLIGFMSEWIQSGMNADPALICQKMEKTFAGSLLGVLERCASGEA